MFFFGLSSSLFLLTPVIATGPISELLFFFFLSLPSFLLLLLPFLSVFFFFFASFSFLLLLLLLHFFFFVSFSFLATTPEPKMRWSSLLSVLFTFFLLLPPFLPTFFSFLLLPFFLPLVLSFSFSFYFLLFPPGRTFWIGALLPFFFLPSFHLPSPLAETTPGNLCFAFSFLGRISHLVETRGILPCFCFFLFILICWCEVESWKEVVQWRAMELAVVMEVSDLVL